MPVYKDKETNTWRVLYRYRTITGETKQTQKRGFTTKREALLWEREQALRAQVKMNMTFASFIDVYTADKKSRLKLNTWLSKEYIIKQKLLPYFGHLQMDEIGAKEVLAWQNAMINYRDKDGKPYSRRNKKSLLFQLIFSLINIALPGINHILYLPIILISKSIKRLFKNILSDDVFFHRALLVMQPFLYLLILLMSNLASEIRIPRFLMQSFEPFQIKRTLDFIHLIL